MLLSAASVTAPPTVPVPLPVISAPPDETPVPLTVMASVPMLARTSRTAPEAMVVSPAVVPRAALFVAMIVPALIDVAPV